MPPWAGLTPPYRAFLREVWPSSVGFGRGTTLAKGRSPAGNPVTWAGTIPSVGVPVVTTVAKAIARPSHTAFIPAGSVRVRGALALSLQPGPVS
jgi:hypothetical protein